MLPAARTEDPGTDALGPSSVVAEVAAPVAAARGPIARALAFLGPDFSAFLVFFAVFVGLAVAYGAHFHVWGEGTILIGGGIALGLVGVRFLWRAPAIMSDKPGARADFRRAAKEILRDWGPMILLTIVFENLHAYTGRVRPVPIDDWLYHFDVKLFGVEPSVWMGRFASPLLTDWFAFSYGLYFILPMILATSLSLRRQRADFREMTTGIVLHMCIGFLGFIVFPAGPPRFYAPLVHGGFNPPVLTSFFGLFELSQGAFDTANPVATHSSFPSMHCALATLTLLYAWRFGRAVFPSRQRLYFWICLPLVISLWTSTVYLRHHWVPDCVAGILLGLATYLITPIIRKAWPDAETFARV